MAYDTESLLSMIERRAAIPLSQVTFTEDEILEIANEVVSDIILPDILKARQEYFVIYEDLTLTQGSSDNDPWIRIPARAIGQTIVSVSEPDNDFEFDPCAYWVEGSKIYFDTDRSTPVRVRYHLRPGQLVTLSKVGVITSIDTNTNTVGVSARPDDFTDGARCDFIRGNAAFDLLAKDQVVTFDPNIATNLIFSTLPSELQVGDYVCLADQSPVPQIPIEWFSYLSQHVAAIILEANGDFEAAKKIESKLPLIRSNALSLISQRVERKSKAIK
jgi:hypothetical protein